MCVIICRQLGLVDIKSADSQSGSVTRVVTIMPLIRRLFMPRKWEKLIALRPCFARKVSAAIKPNVVGAHVEVRA
jgi:hypothetical protein